MSGYFLALGTSVFWDQYHVLASLRSLPWSVLATSSGHWSSLPDSQVGRPLEQPQPGAQEGKVGEDLGPLPCLDPE